MKYPVNNIYDCIQGEGAQTGIPMYMLRLHGCPVGCPWCDTKETWTFKADKKVESIAEALGANAYWCLSEPGEIAEHINGLRAAYGEGVNGLRAAHGGSVGPKWVLVSGGEPAMVDLSDLVRTLHGNGYKVSIETSGTFTGHVGADFDWVTVSPKLNMPGKYLLQQNAMRAANEIKYPIGKLSDLDDLLSLIELGYIEEGRQQICLQPLSQNPKATELCMREVSARGWRLSVQIHKYLGLR